MVEMKVIMMITMIKMTPMMKTFPMMMTNTLSSPFSRHLNTPLCYSNHRGKVKVKSATSLEGPLGRRLTPLTVA